MPDLREDLDDLFGPPLEPSYVRDTERQASFSHTFMLDSMAAQYLNHLLDLSDSYATFQDLTANLCFLWAVAEDGEIWVTLEEVCLLGQLGRRFPRMRNMPLHSSLEALGHPLLVAQGLARIAGELILDYDIDNKSMTWVINNKSGRYGFGDHRTESHLSNVASRFSTVGLFVEINYIEGR